MQNVEEARKDKPFIYLIWVKCMRNFLGTSMRLLIYRKMSSNIYLFGLQTYKLVVDYILT